MADKAPSTQILLYQTEDRRTRIEVRLENETVWLNQLQMAELFQTTVPNVSMHIRNIFREGELGREPVVKDFLTTTADGKSYRAKFYNLDALNRIVAAYLEFAELQARNSRPMYMQDWIAKLNDFLRLSEREILTHAGRVSHEMALAKAEGEFEKFQARQLAQPTEVEKQFEAVVKDLKKFPSKRPTGKKRGKIA